MQLNKFLVNLSILESIGKCCKQLKRFVLKDAGITDRMLGLMVELKFSLKYLNLSGNSLTPAGLEILLNNWTSLEKLDLTRCGVNSIPPMYQLYNPCLNIIGIEIE